MRRRTVLATLGSGATALTGGCLRRMRTLTGWRSSQQMQLRIKTLPADADPYALGLARAVAEWFRAAGIDAGVVPMSEEELLRQTLVRNEFELFVTRLPSQFRDPDALYTLLHSRFADAAGWQNPFGYANLDVDELIETQRRTDGEQRRDVLERLQLTISRTQPFTLLAVPDDIRAARESAYTNWRTVTPRSPLGYLSLERSEETGSDTSDDADSTLQIAVTDHRGTTNLNPLSVEFRRDGVLTGLLYDPLGYVVDGSVTPWLAESWLFSDESPPVARIRLRERASWHDGEPITPADVAFTYELLADTSLGTETDTPVPSPQFRGRSSLVDEVRTIDDTTVEFRFVDADPNVAVRALTVPILPRHVWRDRTETVSIGDISVGAVTDALVTNNIPPIGSGPLRFVRNTPRERLVLERVDDHFLNREGDSPASGLAATVGRVPFDQFSVRVVGSGVTGIEMVTSGEADVTGTSVEAATVPRIGREEKLELLVSRSNKPYILGYNVRRPHLNNPQLRHTLARLIDGAYLTEQVLNGYGRPAVGPLWGTRWYPDALEWEDGNPMTPFLGDDGEVDAERARAAFHEAGYRYADGKLIGGSA